LAEEKRGRLWLVIAGQTEGEVTDRISLGREILVFYIRNILTIPQPVIFMV